MLKRVTEAFSTCPCQIISLIMCYDLSFLTYCFFCMSLNIFVFNCLLRDRLSKRFSTHLQKDNDFQHCKNSPLQYFSPDFQIKPAPSSNCVKIWVPLLMPKWEMGISKSLFICAFSLTSGF